MNIQIPTWLKPRTKKGLILEIAGITLLLLLMIGGILLQLNPLLKQHVLCPACSTATSTSADSNLYIMSHVAMSTTSFASETFLYTLNAQTGKVKHTTDLHEMGEIYYQKIINGVSYVVFGNGVGSAPGNNDTLLATRLSDGKTLWKNSLGPVDFEDAIPTPTVLYLSLGAQASAPSYLTAISAINLVNGRTIWRYEPQPTYEWLLDNNTLFLQEMGDSTLGLHEHIFALSADTGKILWQHTLNDTSNSPVTPVADEGHVFFVSQHYQHTATIFAYDENSGAQLWKETLNDGDTLSYLHIENHYLLIETFNHKLTVLRDTDKSAIWSHPLQSSYEQQSQQQNTWVYTSDVVYGLSSEIDQQTFTTNRFMQAWRISDGKNLFHVKLDLAGEFFMVQMQNQLILTSKNDGIYDNAFNIHTVYNDVESRQAQTGALLWHKHFGQPPAYNSGQFVGWNLAAINTTEFNKDFVFGYTTYSLPADGVQNSSLLYITQYNDYDDSHMFYALNPQNGSVLWQIDPDTLDIDPSLHGLIHTLTLAGANYVVTEFPLATADRAPLAITSGPDGNIWFTESPFAGDSPAQIGRITPGGSITEFPILNGNSIPGGITSGPDGNLWFTEGSNNTGNSSPAIGRITPEGKITEFPIPNANSNPVMIKSGSDGNLWFTDTRQIGRITPEGKITEFSLPHANSNLLGITSGPDGNLWFTASYWNGPNSYGEIGRITPEGKITAFPLPTVNSSPLMITSGPDGDLWFTGSRWSGPNSYGEIGRVTPEGKISEFSIPNSHNVSQGGGGAPYGIQFGPVAITSGPDGNLWFTEASGKLGRVTPDGSILKFAIPTANASSYGITRGSNGDLWFTDISANQIGRIAFKK